MERIFRVHTVKLAGPGLSSMSPQRRRQARRKGLAGRRTDTAVPCHVDTDRQLRPACRRLSPALSTSGGHANAV